MEAAGPNLRILVDADACPVKDEIYRVAGRYGLRVFVVANSAILIPHAPGIERVVVGAGPDAADDWIAERADQEAIVVTSDIPLASRCIKSGADVIAQRETLYRKLDRDGPGDAQSDGPPSLVRTVDSGAKVIRPARPFEFPRRA